MKHRVRFAGRTRLTVVLHPCRAPATLAIVHGRQHGKGGSTMADTTEDVRGISVPYMSFQGFRSLLDRLRREGLPQVFDRSFFGEVSGSLIAQIRGTLRFFDLID